MIVYKEIEKKLKAAGYSTYRLQKERLISNSVMLRIKKGAPVTIDTIDIICELTGLQPSDILQHVYDEKTTAKIIQEHLNKKNVSISLDTIAALCKEAGISLNEFIDYAKDT